MCNEAVWGDMGLETCRHSDRDGRAVCILCRTECKNVVHVLWVVIALAGIIFKC